MFWGGVYKSYLIGFFVFFFSFFVTALISSNFTPVSDTLAYTHTDSNSTTGYYVTLTSADEVDLSVDATPVGQMMAASDTVNVVTNAPTGYKLYISASSSSLTSSDPGVSASFASTSGTLSNPTTLALNTWGFSLNSKTLPIPEASSTWAGVQTTDMKIAESSNATDETMGIDTTVYYGINVDTTMPSSTYTTTITYTAVAEGALSQTMQDFTIEQCESITTDTSIYLMDTRNNKTYRVVKARDGNCWMADNLSIYNQQLTSADTNIEQGTTFTLPASSSWTTNDYTQPLVHIATNTGYEGEVYYNYCSAVALTGSDCATTAQQQYNICPKGWTLPVTGTTSTDKTYIKLMNAYGYTTGAQLVADVSLGYTYSGSWVWWNDGFEADQGTAGAAWISTPNSASGGYIFGYASHAISYQDNHVNNSKGRGFNIRCVFENRTMQDITYMQDMTTEICANTAEHYSKSLTDSRDTKSYRVTKLKDGNCWMTQNLALDGDRTITPTESDVKTNVTLPANIVVGTASANNIMQIVPKVSGQDGNYYNWCAATATGDCSNITTAQNTSVCPKSFRLPGESGNPSFQYLLGDVDYEERFVEPYSFTKSGCYYAFSDYTYHSPGSVEYYWSNIVSSSLAWGNPQNPSYWAGYAFSVRCVSR